MLPVGITCGCRENQRYLRLSWDYLQAVERAGGFPVPLMFLEKGGAPAALRLIRALILSGGGDVHPKHFGEEPLPGCGEISPVRDEMELELARLALEIQMPVLGICRGAQVLNIALGGDIFQDLRSRDGFRLEHMQKAPAHHPYHRVAIREETLLGRILARKELYVNSFHHQAIRKPGKGLLIAATATDGVIEAVESARHPFALGVQWHPESMAQNNTPGGQELFNALLQAAQKNFGTKNFGGKKFRDTMKIFHRKIFIVSRNFLSRNFLPPKFFAPEIFPAPRGESLPNSRTYGIVVSSK